MRFSAILGAVLFGAWNLPLAATSQVQCVANAGSPLTARAEGLTERISDIILQCTGGNITPPGRPVPTVNLSITLNTNVGNLLTGGSSLTDAVLMIDNPSAANQALNDPSQPLTVVGVDGGINYANPFSAVNMGQRVPNVFQGRMNDRNSVVWLGVAIDPPGSVASRIIRITNVRARAADFTGAFIRATLNSPGLNLAVPLDVATTQPGLLYAQPDRTLYTGIIGANAFPVGTALNPDLPNSPANPTASFQARFVEGFATAFRTRTAAQGSDSNPFPAPQDQPVPGQNYFAETGYYNQRLNLGLSNYGTRFGMVFFGAPQNVRLFIRARTGTGTSPTLAAVGLSDCAGPASLAPTTNGLYEVPLTNGGGIFCAEVIRHSPTAVETAIFDGFISFPGSNVAAGVIGGDLLLTPTSFYPPSLNAGSPTAPLFSKTADPVQTWQSIQGVSRLFGPGDPATNVIQVILSPAFQTRILQGSGNPILGTNIVVINSATPRPATITPILRGGPTAQREATAGWLSTTQSQGSTPLTLNIQANTTGLAPGTYMAGVRIDTPPPNATANEIPVQLVVPGPGPRVSTLGVVGAADYTSGVVTAGQAIVIFGSGFGPSQLAGLALGEDGRVATMVGETRVLFDNQPAPIIYAANGQVSAFVPFGVAGRTVTEMRVEYRGVQSPPVFVRVLASVPGLFTANASGSGQGAILNQDGTPNSVANPAAPGDVVVLFGSGAGQTDPPGVDGRLAGLPLSALTQPVQVLIDGQVADVAYAGPAPGLAEGVLQVNARVPANVRRGANVEVQVIVGQFRSQPGVTVAIRP